MKPLNFTAKVLMIAVVVITASACGKKKNGGSSPVATTPTNTNPNTCPQDGKYTDPTTGQVKQCTPGSTIVPPPGNWNGQPNFQYGGCSVYEQQWGVPYVPVYMQQYGGFMCVRYDLLAYQYSQPNYGHYGYDYYYSYPPHSGNGCGNQINFGGQWGYVGLCF